MFQLRRIIGSSCRISTTKGLAVIDKKIKKIKNEKVSLPWHPLNQ
jgi:hypothetical protein